MWIHRIIEWQKQTPINYILKNTSAPTVIVECGFLSNPEEESLLISAAYQEKLVEALQKGICAYLVEH